MRIRPEAVAALLLCASAVGAQMQPAPVVFLEKAYFALGTPTGKNLKFEGQPSAHFFLTNGYNDLEWQKNGGFAWAMPISEVFVVRMSNTVSEPVLTPSYHIGPRLQGIWLIRPDSGTSHKFWMVQGLTGAVHHSNGQQGCMFQGLARDATSGICDDTTNAALANQRLTNTRDGDFSTSYVPAQLKVRYGSLITPSDWLKWQVTLGAEHQWHPYEGLPGVATTEQASVYGKNQWSLFAEWECRIGKRGGVVRLAGDYTQRYGGGVKAFGRGSGEASYVVDEVRLDALRVTIQRVGAFVRRSSGFDYYNINFQDRRGFLALGLMFDPARLDALESNVANDGAARTTANDGCIRFWQRSARTIRPR